MAAVSEPTTETCEFRIAGRMSEELTRSFEPKAIRYEHGETVLLRDVGDDAELFGVISRCEALRLRLTSLRRLPAQPSPLCHDAPLS